jgi:hypothetical protein
MVSIQSVVIAIILRLAEEIRRGETSLNKKGRERKS